MNFNVLIARFCVGVAPGAEKACRDRKIDGPSERIVEFYLFVEFHVRIESCACALAINRHVRPAYTVGIRSELEPGSIYPHDPRLHLQRPFQAGMSTARCRTLHRET